MQKEEQKKYLSAKELVAFGIDCIDETVTFRSLKSEQQEEVIFSSLGISFSSGELSVLSSKNVVDNSVFALNLLNDMSVKQGLPAAYFSIGSIDYENIVYNLLAMNTKVHLGKIQGARIDMQDFEKIKETAGSLYNANFSVFYSEEISPKEYFLNRPYAQGSDRNFVEFVQIWKSQKTVPSVLQFLGRQDAPARRYSSVRAPAM